MRTLEHRERMKISQIRAFTIIELLISLSILSVIAVVSYSSFVAIRRVSDLNRESEKSLRDMRGFLERLDRELAAAVYIRRDKQTLFLSQRLDIEGREANNLIFTTIYPQSLLETGTRGEIIKIEYSVQPNEEKRGFFIVKKRIFFFLFDPQGRQEPVEYTVRDDFSYFTLRFYSRGRWHDSWDTRKNDLLPEGVEIIFSLGRKRYRDYFNVFISEI